MGANRSPAVKTKAYIEIDIDALKKHGEIIHIGNPIIAPEITTRVPRGKFEVYLLDNKDSNNQLNMTFVQKAR